MSLFNGDDLRYFKLLFSGMVHEHNQGVLTSEEPLAPRAIGKIVVI